MTTPTIAPAADTACPYATELQFNIQATQSYSLTLKVRQDVSIDRVEEVFDNVWLHQMDGSEIESLLAQHGIDAECEDPEEEVDLEDYSASLEHRDKDHISAYSIVSRSIGDGKFDYVIADHRGMCFTTAKAEATRFLSYSRAESIAKVARLISDIEPYRIQAHSETYDE